MMLDSFMAGVRKTGLPTIADSGGDPWVFDADSVSEEVMTGWLEGGYFTRRLYALALEYAGMRDAGIHVFKARIDRNGGKLDSTDLRRVRRYARSRIGMAT